MQDSLWIVVMSRKLNLYQSQLEIEMNDIKKLLDKITVENVTSKIEDGCYSSQTIAKFIVGTNIWDALPDWDRRKLAMRTYNVILKNRLLEDSKE